MTVTSRSYLPFTLLQATGRALPDCQWAGARGPARRGSSQWAGCCLRLQCTGLRLARFRNLSPG